MSKKLKKGFTLVELIVVMMLMGLITTAIVMVLQPTSNLYADVKNKSSEETGAITLFDYINGELRYATNITIVSSDSDTAIPAGAGTNKNFIMLSNNTRSASLKGARGFTKHGLVSNFAGAVPCVSDGILDENDFQFSISGSVTEAGSESLSIQALAHPMKANYSSFTVNEDKPYTYNETFQLVNMQNRSKLTTRVVGSLSVSGYDPSKSVIWIFYEKPSESTSTGSAGSGGSGGGTSGGVGTPTYTKRGTKTVDLTVSTAMLTVHFQVGNLTDKKEYDFFYDGTATTYESDNTKSSNQQQHYASDSGTVDKYVFFDPGSKLTIKVDNNNTVVKEVTYDEVKNGTVTELWLYDWESNDSAYTPPTAYGTAKTLTVHLIKGQTSSTSGLMIEEKDGINQSVMIGTNYVDNQQNWYDNQTADYKVTFYMTGSRIQLYNRTNGNPTYMQTIKSDDLPDTSEIWICNGVIYYSAADVPAVPTPIITPVGDALITGNDTYQAKVTIQFTNSGTVNAKAWEFSFEVPFDVDGWDIGDGVNGVFNSYYDKDNKRMVFTKQNPRAINVGSTYSATVTLKSNSCSIPANFSVTAAQITATPIDWD